MGKYGWVYVYDTAFRENGKGIYKIGRSVNPQFRVQEFNAGNPYGEILFAGFVGRDAKEVEARVHCHYQGSWIQGELFYLTDFELSELRLKLRSISTQWYERGEGEKLLSVSMYQGPWRYPWERSER